MNTMHYILVDIHITLREYSPTYIREHVIKSLDRYFSKADEKFVNDLYSLDLEDGSALCFNINDVANPDTMLILAYHGKTSNGAHKVSYVNRIKG